MKVIVFKKDKKIISIQGDGIDDETPEKIKTFNKENTNKQAELYELNEVELYLYEKQKVKITNFKESLQDILCAVQDLDSNLEWLEKICKDGEY